jgi:hypothetical protein
MNGLGYILGDFFARSHLVILDEDSTLPNEKMSTAKMANSVLPTCHIVQFHFTDHIADTG